MTSPASARTDQRDQRDQRDLADVARQLFRGWRVITTSFVVCVLGAVAVLIWAPPVWTAHSSVLVKDATPLGSALAQQLTSSNGVAGAASSLLSGQLRSSVETDMALLKSRDLIGEVVDSLDLVVVVTSPRGTAPGRVVADAALNGAYRSFRLHLARAGSGVHVTGKAAGERLDTIVAPGGTIRTPVGTLQLAADALLPASLKVYDREETITDLWKHVDVERLGGDVIGIAWPAGDSLTAPAAANVMVRRFLVRRKGVDRTINERKLDFVTAQIDSVNAALTVALRRQRDFHARAQSVDMEAAAKAYLEALLQMRQDREKLVMEEEALNSLLRQLANHELGERQLAAYPSFLKSQAIGDLLGEIGRLEAERAALFKAQRREDDPRITGIAASVASLEGQLEPLARTYSSSVTQQRAVLDQEIDSVTYRLNQLPDQVEQAFKYSSEVERLAKTSLALSAQRVELRLATVGEGGEARTVDVAHPQWKRTFPSRPITLLAGGFAGLAIGAALVLGGVGGRREPEEAGSLA